MKEKSSYLLPLFVILILGVLISVVILVKNISPNLLDSNYWGEKETSAETAQQTTSIITETSNETDATETSNETDTPETESQPSITENNNNENSDTENSSSTTKLPPETIQSPEQTQQPSNTPPEKTPFEFNRTYIQTLQKQNDAKKIDFLTASSSYDYRFLIKTKVNNTPAEGNIFLTVFDEKGIKLKSYDFSPRYDNSPYYCDEESFDLTLEQSKKYSFKIYTDNGKGDYEFSLIQLPRDAGYNRENATALEVGTEITAQLNSSLSDWYKCSLTEAGKYNITVHNIDVGCTVEITGSENDLSLFSTYVKNEDSTTRNINNYTNTTIYIQLTPRQNTANGNYIISVQKAS